MKTRLRDLPFLAAITLFAGWFLLLAPTSIGGPATYVWVSGESMEPTLRDGDFVILRRADAYRNGDIVAFRVGPGEPGAGRHVIHRIIGGSAEAGFITQGDNKERPDRWRPTGRDIVGARWFVVPGGGQAIRLLQDPAIFASVAAGLTVFFVMLGDPGKWAVPGWARRRIGVGR